MLSPSSPAHKTLSKEDSSGSDVESEASLEPETDRFGFIVTNGSTAGSVGPPPELVRQREAKWINIMVQWDRILLKKTNKVKVQCQKGIPASLRAKCWPLLCGATDRMKQNEKLYQSLDLQPALQSWVDVIERDLDRQFPFHEMFLSKDGHGQRGLFRVLKAYTQHQPDEGYCQAQGPVAAVLLMNMPAEEAFWCLVQISEHYLPGYYSPLLEGVLFDAAMLMWVLKRTCPAAQKHLQHHGVEPLMFATDWLMCLFTRHLPFNTLLRVWDLFFCYGVRVLLQVAVVLVRRVLGRAEQRKQCQGQMEILERLRGVREQVQDDDDDSFIAEVCSVQLSARDLQKRTEKELEKWRKDRPSSTFDPSGRCLGYRMAWARARQNAEERDRTEREKGNLSIPLARSSSTLSLSPSILQKRWRKGGKVNAGEWESRDKVVRHFSMGAKEDCRSWAELNFKKVQGVQEEEDVFSEDHKKQSEPKLSGQTEQKEPEKMDNIQNIPTEQAEETVRAKEQIEQEETTITEKEESQLKHEEENKMLPEKTEETNVETETTKDQTNDQTVENILQQGEELDSDGQSQVFEPQSHRSTDQDDKVTDTNNETEKQEAESKHADAVEETQTKIQKDADAGTNTEVELEITEDPSEERMTQADMKPKESTETENVQQVDAVTEVSDTTTERSPGCPETDGEVEDPTVKETQQKQEKVIMETNNSSQGDAFDGKYRSTESLAEIKEESHTQTETEADVLAQTQEQFEQNTATWDKSEAETVQLDSGNHIDSKTKAETLLTCSPECTQPTEGTEFEAEAETEAEIQVSEDILVESSETQCSETECDTGASESAQEIQERSLTAHSEVKIDVSQAEETPTQMNENTIDSIAPRKETSAQVEEVNAATEPDGTTSSVGISTTEEPAPEQPMIEAPMGAVEEEESTENIQENTVGEDNVFIPTEPTNAHSDPQVQDKEPPLEKDQTEQNNSSLTQASSRRNSRSSADFCIRKSASSRGSRLGRRLSNDLFTEPQKTCQLKSTPNQTEVKDIDSESRPGAVNPTQTEVISPLSEEAPEETEVHHDPPKHFGLFRRLRGEKVKKSKMQIPKILIQDFSDGTGMEKVVEDKGEEKLSSKERRRRRREQERREKEEEKMKKREKELEKERRKPQTRGKSFQVQRKKESDDEPQPAKTGSQRLRYSGSYAELYF